jgi:hypothetical protein
VRSELPSSSFPGERVTISHRGVLGVGGDLFRVSISHFDQDSKSKRLILSADNSEQTSLAANDGNR